MSRYVPVLARRKLRTAIGLAIAVLSVVISMTGRSRFGSALGVFVLAWLVAILLTDKYTHKYPYRYSSYLIASHSKAAVLMALAIGFSGWLHSALQAAALWRALGWFILFDLLVSVPRRYEPVEIFDPAILTSREVSAQADSSEEPSIGSAMEVVAGVLKPAPRFSDVAVSLDRAVVQHIRASVPDFHENMPTRVLDNRNTNGSGRDDAQESVDLLVSQVPINDLRRINRFLITHTSDLRMGGHFVGYYVPLESVRASLKRRWKGLFGPAFLVHFAWYRVFPKIPLVNRFYFVLTRGKSRNLSKAEVWGRLSFCGLRVIAEKNVGEGRFVTAKRTTLPITNRRPSYYPVVALTKVGLDGQMLRTHKVRSMYPFSEFLQKQIFEDHGLATTGKFENDFRLTGYGRTLRRYWLDELPQVFDWLRGDIKLVGIRATSPHFLSLYPEDFLRLYILVKPGLIPPLFNEDTDGFEDIVKVEVEYLTRYAQAPTLTDLQYFWVTFRDIFFRGVRSK